ncbi:hypothetical protein FJZ31_11370 [Candidatus Poribacteria bacterium]|nr:hypothetical protein [Candidatus Poribacteria bacterium]
MKIRKISGNLELRISNLRRIPFAHDSSVVIAPSSLPRGLGAYNSGHAATLRSSQIRPSGELRMSVAVM